MEDKLCKTLGPTLVPNTIEKKKTKARKLYALNVKAWTYQS